MPRAKKKKSLAQNQSQFSRSIKNNKRACAMAVEWYGKYRGYNPPKPYKRKSRKPKRIWDKEPLKVKYQPKYSEDEEFFNKM